MPSSKKKVRVTKKRKISTRNTTGYTGVSITASKKFMATIYFDKKQRSLGNYATPKEAALAYDRAVLKHKLPKTKLNYPGGLSKDDPDYGKFENPLPMNRMLRLSNTTGYRGVSKVGKRYKATIRADGKYHYLATFATAKEAACMFDRAVLNYNQSRNRLNFPDSATSSDEGNDVTSRSALVFKAKATKKTTKATKATKATKKSNKATKDTKASSTSNTRSKKNNHAHKNDGGGDNSDDNDKDDDTKNICNL